MPVINSALGLVGLATRQQLQRAVDRKDRWHGLIREVFGPYYLKFRQTSLGNMPELPSRYSEAWERRIRAELDQFLTLDLESVGALLDACGFGTQKWQKLQETGFPALRRLMDQIAENGDLPSPNGDDGGRISDAALTAAVNEDVLDLLQRHPEAVAELVRRLDPDSGRLLLDDGDLEASERFRQLQDHHEAVLEELRRFRRGGRQALDRIRRLQQQIEVLQARAQPVAGPDVGRHDDDLEREVATLRKELRAREASSAALRSRVEALEARLAGSHADPGAAMKEALAEAEAGIEARDETIVRLQERIERLEETQAERVPPQESEQLRTLRSQLQARDHTIEALRREIEALQTGDATEHRGGAGGHDSDEDAAELRSLLAAREHTIASLREEIARLEVEGEETGLAREAQEDTADERRTEEVESLRRDLSLRDQTILDLRKQVHAFEEELGQARDELLAEVAKLKGLTSGELEIKPSEELDGMDSEALLSYARDVAEDLDVRRQTLDEGLQGIDSVKDSYAESKRVYQQQERRLQEQLESMRAELENYQQQQAREGAAGNVDEHETIVKQRQQLDLLSTRIRQLVGSNRDLNESNKKMYENLEQAVKRVIPLRKQIEELDSLNEALQRYIRQTHDRTFTTRKLATSGVR